MDALLLNVVSLYVPPCAGRRPPSLPAAHHRRLPPAMVKQVHFLDGVSQSLIDSTTVPKNRKPKFELSLKIVDLNNVPLVSGSAYVKWHVSHSATGDHNGKTPRAPIKEHKVAWNYEKKTSVRLTADKNGNLQDTELDLEVFQEYASGRAGAERIMLGVVRLNLAEYVDATPDGDEGVVRRYLMQESKINSTLKLAIMMTQTEGDKNFKAPTLKSAPIFGGIAGIMSAEQADPEDGPLPTTSRKLARETGEMQDLYRRALTASYNSGDADLPADECIEDIFAGGDGWGKRAKGVTFHPHSERRGSDEESIVAAKMRSPRSPRAGAAQGKSSGHHRKDSKSNEAKSLRDSHANSSSSDDHKKAERVRDRDVSEFDLREDLRSWKISSR